MQPLDNRLAVAAIIGVAYGPAAASAINPASLSMTSIWLPESAPATATPATLNAKLLRAGEAGGAATLLVGGAYSSGAYLNWWYSLSITVAAAPAAATVIGLHYNDGENCASSMTAGGGALS